MRFHAQSVPGAMGEILAVAAVCDHLPGKAVHLAGFYAWLHLKTAL